MTGKQFNIQRYSIHDGPGIRTTVFLKGCPLSCPWCHNPESHSPDPEIGIQPGRCIQCGSCLEVCSFAPAMGPEGFRPVIPSRCVRCGQCAEACPSGARELIGRTVTVQEIMEEVERDLPFYEESGGGVTFSGGEPLMQPEFLLACLRAAWDRGIHTAVDTSGFAPEEMILEVASWTNLFLYDLKILDDARHRKYTGVSVTPILENLRALDAANTQIWLRIPLIPGINDDPSNLEALGGFLSSLERKHSVYLLPYHPLGSDKYRRMGRENPFGCSKAPTPEMLEEAARVFQACGFEVHQGG